jgi:tetratricopeptide (TPR) repeat protein
MKLSDTQRTVLACSALVALSIAIYAQCLGHEFVNIDTASYVTQNPHVLRGLSWDGVRWAFTTFQASNWHPLTWLSHMLDVSLFGTAPAGHQAVNAALHAANGAILFLALQRLTGAFGKSLFVAALFAAHPLHVESVAWIVERKDVLSTLFGFLCFLAWAAYARRGSLAGYALAFFCLALGLLAKPMLVTWPFVLLLFDAWPLARLGLGWKRLVVEKLPFFALSIASSIVTVHAQAAGGAMQSLARLPLAERLENALVAYASYLVKAFFPAGLAVYYPLPVQGLEPGAIALGALVVFAASALALAQMRARPWILVGWLFFLGTLVPVIGLVQVGGQAMADRYTYVPLLGVFVALAWTLELRFPSRPVARATACATIAVLAALAWRQARFWQSSLTLGEHAIEATGENHVAENMVGYHLIANGELAAGLQHLENALRIEPGDVDARDNLGWTLVTMGRIDDGERELRTALSARPKSAAILTHLGRALLVQNHLDDALLTLDEAIRNDPEDADAHASLGVALERKGDLVGAEAHFASALRSNPDQIVAIVGLAKLEIERGAVDQATPGVLHALTLQPSSPQAQQLIARVHSAHGDTLSAIRALEAALRARPGWPLAMSDLAWALSTAADAKLRDPERAIELAEQALAHGNESRASYLDALAVAYAAGGRFEDARATAQNAIEKAQAAGERDLHARIERRLAAYEEGRVDLTIPR